MDFLEVRRVRTRSLSQAKSKGIKVSALTSYDALTAGIFDRAGIDILLVGDSIGTTMLGYETTLPVTLENLIAAGRAVVSATSRALVVVDLPFGSYEASDEESVRSAARVMKETGAAAVKLEGGVRRESTIRAIVDAGIPVMAHIGFTPQAEHGLGGHVVQGRGDAAERVIADARAVEAAGAFAVVLEMVPRGPAETITRELRIPTIGIGAGNATDGQILVWTDFAGLGSGRMPRFVRQYAHLADTLTAAAQEYRSDIASGSFPAEAESFGDER